MTTTASSHKTDGKRMKWKVQLAANEVYLIDLAEQLAIDRSDLDDELLTQPSKYAWFAVLTELARELEAKRKRELDKTEAELYFTLRKKANQLEGKRPSDAYIKNQVILTKDHERAYQRYAMARKQHALLQSAKIALQQRFDVLRSFSANQREERREH